VPKHVLQTLIESKDLSVSFARPKKARSSYWTKFSQVHRFNIPQDYIVCLNCKSLLKWTGKNGTNTMKNHSCSRKFDARTIQMNHQHVPPLHDNNRSSDHSLPQIKEQIKVACAEYCAADGRPFHSVIGQGFITLVQQLLIAGAITGMSANAADLLPQPSTVRINYGGITLHYADSNHKLYTFMLACQAYDYDSQQSPNIRAFLDEISGEFHLQSNEHQTVVTDNEVKMRSAFGTEAYQCLGCSAHYVNKILEHAFKSDKCTQAVSLFESIRDIVTNIKRTHQQSKLSKCLRNYSDSRFSGIYLMMMSFLEVYSELPAILSKEHKQKYPNIQQTVVESLCKYLKDFHDVIEKLSADKVPTLHLVVPFQQLLISRSFVNDDDHRTLKLLKKFIGNELRTY
ncbi:unnamed protein product, partial [Didymodactylos carnosus]